MSSASARFFNIFKLVCKPMEQQNNMATENNNLNNSKNLDPYLQYQEQIQTPRNDIIRDFTTEEVDFLFTYHAPRNDFEKETYRELTRQFRELAQFIAASVPAGPGKTIAIRALSDARMKANAAIALQGRF